VAAATQELFNGRIVEVLNYAAGLVFDDIRDLLQRQFDRLSEIEQEMIVWLAINREPNSLLELSRDVVYGFQAQTSVPFPCCGDR